MSRTLNAGERPPKKGYQHLAPTVEDPREIIQMRSQDYPVRQICRVWGHTRRRYYHRTHACEEAPLKAAIARFAEAWPTSGYRRITALLRREGFSVNRQRVARLMRALAQHWPEIHHADQGVQYAATAYVQTLQDVGAQLSMATAGEPTEKGYAERLMRTIKGEEVTPHDDADVHEADRHIGRFLDHVYQHKRIHSALGYLTPAAFETPWQQQPTAAASIK